MKLLLDTHSWLWFVLGDPSLSPAARALIEDSANVKLISPASYWEVAIKICIGKYALPSPYEEFVRHAIDGQGFYVLPILAAHTAKLCAMPLHHRDPFDRLLVAQAVSEDLPLVSGDRALDAYGVRRLWQIGIEDWPLVPTDAAPQVRPTLPRELYDLHSCPSVRRCPPG